jgi:hypothetical protein
MAEPGQESTAPAGAIPTGAALGCEGAQALPKAAFTAGVMR